MNPYYFDTNATTPLGPEVFQAMEPYFKAHFGNPSSPHQLGQQAARAVKEARRKVAALLGTAEDSEIIFTSGGTESNNAAIRSVLATSNGKREIVTSAVEHSSVRKLCQQLVKEGYAVREIGVDRNGQLKIEELLTALSPQTAIVSLMMANNETGVIFPVEEIGRKIKERGILFHVDAVQAVGKFSMDLKKSPVDFLSVSAHKIYGPKGVGALYVRKGIPFQPLVCGGGQERGRRAGTENVPGIVGLGAACEFIRPRINQEIEAMRLLRDTFEGEVLRQIPGVRITAAASERLANTSHLIFDDLESEALLIALDERGFYASSGSACMSSAQEPSHVLKAMGYSEQEAKAAVRFSFGRCSTQASVSDLVSALRERVERLRHLEESKVL